tara:strand:- start:1221 stop:1448 length:228 start_codon:yes stop_codon:yes gene_type:complete
MTTTIKDNNDLLNFLVSQASARKDWFGFFEQRMTAVTLAHEIARVHADKLTPAEVVQYALDLNQAIYNKIIKAER